MIFRNNLFKITKNLLKRNHLKVFQRITFNQNFIYYSKQSNNNFYDFWSEFDFNKYNENKDIILKDINKFKDSDDTTHRLFPSFPSDDIQSHSKNLIDFDSEYNEKCEEKNRNYHKSDYNTDWLEIISKAEQVVKYPTTFLTLRFLLKDEISYLALHLKRLIDTKHPLLNTAKTILSTNQQIRGLVILLISKAYSVPKHILDNYDSETDRLASIRKNQRKLAEITDMINVSQILHRGIVDLKVSDSNEDIEQQLKEDLHLGNTISLLIGDYLLAESTKAMALFRNPTITGYLAEGFGNYCEAEFLKPHIFKDINNLEFLEKYCYLSGGSFMAQSCRSALLMADFNQNTQKEAFLFGKFIGIAFKLSELLFKQMVCDQRKDDFDDNWKIIDSNSIKSLLRINVENALNLVKSLNSCEATNALIDILLNIENFNQIH